MLESNSGYEALLNGIEILLDTKNGSFSYTRREDALKVFLNIHQFMLVQKNDIKKIFEELQSKN